MRAGRPLKLAVAQQAWLVRHWMDPRLTDEDLAAHLEIGVSTLYTYKTRLRLPNRPSRPIRNERRLEAWRVTMAKRQAEQLEMLSRTVRRNAGINLTRGTGTRKEPPPPLIRRCECGGIVDSRSPETHACRFRAA